MPKKVPLRDDVIFPVLCDFLGAVARGGGDLGGGERPIRSASVGLRRASSPRPTRPFVSFLRRDVPGGTSTAPPLPESSTAAARGARSIRGNANGCVRAPGCRISAPALPCAIPPRAGAAQNVPRGSGNGHERGYSPKYVPRRPLEPALGVLLRLPLCCDIGSHRRPLTQRSAVQCVQKWEGDDQFRRHALLGALHAAEAAETKEVGRWRRDRPRQPQGLGACGARRGCSVDSSTPRRSCWKMPIRAA